MKLIIAGSRDVKDIKVLETAIERSNLDPASITEIVSGKAPGVDTLGEIWAKEHGIPVKDFPALWDDLEGIPAKQIKVNNWGKKYNVRAGTERNQQMADYADAALIIIKDESSGSTDMLKRAKKANLIIHYFMYDQLLMEEGDDTLTL